MTETGIRSPVVVWTGENVAATGSSWVRAETLTTTLTTGPCV